MYRPKCTIKEQNHAVTAKGWLVPCCFIDCIKTGAEEFYAEELKIENNDSIAEILVSPEWLNFAERIKTGKDLPWACAHFCGACDETARR